MRTLAEVRQSEKIAAGMMSEYLRNRDVRAAVDAHTERTFSRKEASEAPGFLRQSFDALSGPIRNLDNLPAANHKQRLALAAATALAMGGLGVKSALSANKRKEDGLSQSERQAQLMDPGIRRRAAELVARVSADNPRARAALDGMSGAAIGTLIASNAYEPIAQVVRQRMARGL
ncbi:hypothetical protein EBT31_07640 [bacterium]|nr:hypothetical protein [bacterium]